MYSKLYQLLALLSSDYHQFPFCSLHTSCPYLLKILFWWCHILIKTWPSSPPSVFLQFIFSFFRNYLCKQPGLTPCELRMWFFETKLVCYSVKGTFARGCSISVTSFHSACTLLSGTDIIETANFCVTGNLLVCPPPINNGIILECYPHFFSNYSTNEIFVKWEHNNQRTRRLQP